MQNKPSLINQYLAVIERVGVDDFDHPELDAIRRQMTQREIFITAEMLKEDAEESAMEAEALLQLGRREFGEARYKQAR
jgi:hypothetical protein